jgi:hemoglobin
MRAVTTFESMGGFARVRLIVSDFYEKILSSPGLSPYFTGVDMRRLIDHQTKFIASVMGGPATFTDDQIARAHARLDISAEAFDEMADLFRETLEDFDVAPVEVERLHAQVLSMRGQVVAAAPRVLP